MLLIYNVFDEYFSVKNYVVSCKKKKFCAKDLEKDILKNISRKMMSYALL